jgi:hypothetical protein
MMRVAPDIPKLPPSPAVLRRRKAAADAAVTVLRLAYADTIVAPLPDALALLLRKLEVPR